MTERQSVEIDYCPQCRGVWLDRGELDKIIERATSELNVPTATVSARDDRERGPRDYQDRGPRDYGHQGEHYGHRKKKKSFLGEIFDFD